MRDQNVRFFLLWRLTEANLFGAKLTGAKMADTLIINCKSFEVLVDTHTDFLKAIVDNLEFIKYLRGKGFEDVPNEIRNKLELREGLLKRDFDQKEIEDYLSGSILPEN